MAEKRRACAVGASGVQQQPATTIEQIAHFHKMRFVTIGGPR
jgi:hypothetical protein